MAHFVGAYWGKRRESRQACADRLEAFIRAISTQDATLSQWFKKTASRRSPLVKLPNRGELLAPLLKTNQRDVTGDAIPELGFNFAAWSGRESGMVASLAATCGGYSSLVSNSLVVSFDPGMSPTLDVLEGIMKAAIAAFDPDDAVANTTESLSAHPSEPAWKAPAILRYKRGSGLSTD
jgi:hypothetical protein